ncbi:TVP38/TMEM64 family protein [Bacillus sp. DJP31]|uniref:TVP38/TMEM64 family protein n=1 Tax=Bacillus sp. DJP31 TaxID=3409789 RepID=UPI003BB7EAE1
MIKKTLLLLFIATSLFILISFWEDIYAFFTQSSFVDMADYIRSMGILAPLISILLMIFQSIAAPIPSFLITGANGMVFGYVWGSIISWFGAMLGATVSYYLARRFGFQFVEKRFKGDKLKPLLNKINGTYGFLFILISRILPIVSFDLISFLAGLSGIRLTTFLVATGIGMVPGTIAYTVIGHDFIDLEKNLNKILILSATIIAVFLIGYLVKRNFKKI